jgi:hypothetical protein
MDVDHHRLVGPAHIIDECELKKPRKYLQLFDNKGIDAVNINTFDAVNINNFLKHKNVQYLYSALF